MTTEYKTYINPNHNDVDGKTDRGMRKDNPIFKTLGYIDELNSFLGTIKNRKNDDGVVDAIQIQLLKISSLFSYYSLHTTDVKNYINLIADWTSLMDSEIEIISSNLKINSFIIPKSKFHYARCLARRVERKTISFFEKQTMHEESFYVFKNNVLAYFNRLSLYLFYLALSI